MVKKNERAHFEIIAFFKRREQATFAQIQQQLKCKELSSSKRTVERLIQELRDEYGYKLTYDSKRMTYTLDAKDNALQSHIINLMVASDFMRSLPDFSKKWLRHISFDEHTVSKGVHHLSDIFQAITQNLWLEIEYQRYDTDTSKTHKIMPLFLKEYNNRWYMLAIIRDAKQQKKDTPVIFGLDRIVSIEPLEKAPKNLFQQTEMYKKMQKEKKISPFDIFHDIIGVSFPFDTVKEVVLSFEARQAPYIKAQPWHHSQEEIRTDNKDEFRIRLFVQPNEDLITLILAQCGRVKVIKPLSLKNEVVAILKKAMSFYDR